MPGGSPSRVSEYRAGFQSSGGRSHVLAQALSRPALTELYKRSGYLVTLTHSPSWEEKFGRQAAGLRRVAQEEFARTARKINHRAEQIGTEADYDEKWGD